VTLDREITRAAIERDVLIPVAAARLDDKNDRVILDTMDATAVEGLPSFDHSAAPGDFESRMAGYNSLADTQLYTTRFRVRQREIEERSLGNPARNGPMNFGKDAQAGDLRR
jgi:hypothetical protein